MALGVQRRVLHAVDHQDWDLDLREGLRRRRRAVGGDPGIVGAIVVHHRAEIRALEGLDVAGLFLRILHPAGEAFGRQHLLRAFLLEVPGVLAVGLLILVRRQLASHAGRVRHRQDHQPVDQVGPGQNDIPGDRRAPVVSDHDRVLLTFGGDHGRNVAYEIRHRVGGLALRLVGEVVAAGVQRGSAIARGRQGGHQGLPGRPVVGEAVDHHDKRALTFNDIVDLHRAVLRVPVLRSRGRRLGMGRRLGRNRQQHGGGEPAGQGHPTHLEILP